MKPAQIEKKLTEDSLTILRQVKPLRLRRKLSKQLQELFEKLLHLSHHAVLYTAKHENVL